MKVRSNKKIILITAIMLLLLATVGTSLAFIFTKTGPVDNGFESAAVSCAVVENDNDPVNSGIQNVETKRDVKIQNTGDIPAYIRATVVYTWKSADGANKVYALSPVEDVDYTVEASDSDLWQKGSDGYYYYATPVSAGECTQALLKSVDQILPGPIDSNGTQYYLSVEIIASAIQSTPESVVEEQWKVNVNDGRISK